MERHKRSILKSLTWRILATCMTIMLVFVFTGEALVSLEVGAIEVVCKMVLYYFHERVWDAVPWGKIK